MIRDLKSLLFGKNLPLIAGFDGPALMGIN